MRKRGCFHIGLRCIIITKTAASSCLCHVACRQSSPVRRPLLKFPIIAFSIYSSQGAAMLHRAVDAMMQHVRVRYRVAQWWPVLCALIRPRFGSEGRSKSVVLFGGVNCTICSMPSSRYDINRSSSMANDLELNGPHPKHERFIRLHLFVKISLLFT